MTLESHKDECIGRQKYPLIKNIDLKVDAILSENFIKNTFFHFRRV